MVSTASEPSPPAATNRWWRCSTADCGWSVTTAFLSSSVPTTSTRLREHRTSESPTEKSPRQTSMRTSSGAGSPSPGSCSGISRRADADEVALRVAGRGHVQLVAAYDGRGDPDRALSQAAALARVAQPPVGGADGLLEHDRDARRFVVVVLAPDGVGDQAARVAGLAAGDLAGHDQVRLPLVRDLEPVVGSVTRIASDELARRSSSETTPYFSASRDRHGRESI